MLFPLAYACLAITLWRWGGWPANAIVAALVACVPLGFFALAYFRWMNHERHRLRLAFLAATHRRVVARVRAERRRLIRMLDDARRDYLAATGGPEHMAVGR